MDDLSSISLKELHELLNQRLHGTEWQVSYSTLSSFVNFDKDISAMLGMSGGKNLKKFPPVAVDILAEFWPIYQERGGQKPKAYEILRQVLDSGSAVRGTAELVPAASSSLARRTPEPSSSEVRQTEEARGRAEGLARGDEVWTAEEAANFLRISPRQLRIEVKPSFRIGKFSRGDRWKKSDLLSL